MLRRRCYRHAIWGADDCRLVGAPKLRPVAAGGTLANLTAALIFWIVLRGATGASVRLRYFLLLSLAFNLFSGTGYFFFSGVTNFGDWAVVIAGLQAHWLWRWLLVVVGIAAYYGAVLLVGSGLVRYVGVPRSDARRLTKLTLIPYLAATLLVCAGGLLNPLGIQLVWQSALPGTAGADSGLLWLRYYIPRGPFRSELRMELAGATGGSPWLRRCRSSLFLCWGAGSRCTASLPARLASFAGTAGICYCCDFSLSDTQSLTPKLSGGMAS